MLGYPYFKTLTMLNDKQEKDLLKFIRLKDEEIRRQIERRKIALSQRNWMILLCLIGLTLKVIEWLQ